MRNLAMGLIVVLAAVLAGAGPAGATPTVSGTLTITATTPTTVSFSVTAGRTCVAGEQCDYYADLEDLSGAGDCPTTYPADPFNIWNGQVTTAGPTTETATITPTGWAGRTDPGPERLCLFIYADGTYYYTDGTTITRPPAPAGGDGTTTSTTPPPGGVTLPGGGTTRTPVSGSSGQSSTRTPAARVRVGTVALGRAATSAKAALKRTYGKRFSQGRRYRATCRRVSRTHVRCAVSWRNGGTWRGTVDVTGAVRGGRQVLVTRVRVKRPSR